MREKVVMLYNSINVFVMEMESIHFNYSLRNVDGLACISKCILYLYLILLTHP